jgi:hypothetical protein
MAAGQFAAAHQQLVKAQQDTHISARQRVEVAEGLCITEYKIGAPAYPEAEQASACSIAATGGSRQSAELLSRINTEQRTDLVSKADHAIAVDDLAGAEEAISRYRSLPGRDPRQIAVWSKKLWIIVRRSDTSAARSRRSVLQPAISDARRTYPHLQGMGDQVFARWIEKNLRVDGSSLASSVRVARTSVLLRIPENNLDKAAINLDRFARINDAMIARCGCDGRTDVALQNGDLPAYLVRLDPQTRRSEILVLAYQ